MKYQSDFSMAKRAEFYFDTFPDWWATCDDSLPAWWKLVQILRIGFVYIFFGRL